MACPVWGGSRAAVPLLLPLRAVQGVSGVDMVPNNQKPIARGTLKVGSGGKGYGEGLGDDMGMYIPHCKVAATPGELRTLV